MQTILRTVIAALVATVLVAVVTWAIPTPPCQWPDDCGGGGGDSLIRTFFLNDGSINNNTCAKYGWTPGNGNQANCVAGNAVQIRATSDITVTRISAAVSETAWDDGTQCDVTIRANGTALAGVTAITAGSTGLDDAGEAQNVDGLNVVIPAGQTIEMHMLSPAVPACPNAPTCTCATGLGGSLRVDLWGTPSF